MHPFPGNASAPGHTVATKGPQKGHAHPTSAKHRPTPGGAPGDVAGARRMPSGAQPSWSDPPQCLSGTPPVWSGAPSSASSSASQFGRAMAWFAWRAARWARSTPIGGLGARAFERGAPPPTADARSAVGDTQSFVAESPLKTRGAWMPPSGARPGAACARASAARRPHADCGRRGNWSGRQSVWLGAQGFWACAPGALAGGRAPVRDLAVSTVLVFVVPIQIQTLGGGAWERVLGC